MEPSDIGRSRRQLQQPRPVGWLVQTVMVLGHLSAADSWGGAGDELGDTEGQSTKDTL